MQENVSNEKNISEEKNGHGSRKKTFFEKIREKIPILRKITPVPAVLCFEHLYSEYSSLKYENGKKLSEKKFSDEEENFIEKLFRNRERDPPTWQELYRVELILAKRIPAENLLSKVKRLRFEFQSIVGQQEYEQYMSSKPADLQSPPDKDKEVEKIDVYYAQLSEDLKDLLDRIYLRYAILPIKEKKLNQLTAVSAGLCFVSLFILLGIVVVLFLRDTKDIASLTILIVVITGAMGGFVSALRRIQNQPAHGDSIYNFALLFHGSHSVLVAPVSGAIFAILLYLMFTSQVLRGTFFPEIYTPRAQRITQSGEITGGSRGNRPGPPTPPANENTNKTKTESSQPAGSGNQAAAANTTAVTASSSTTAPKTPASPANENANKTETEAPQQGGSGNEAAEANTNATETRGASTTETSPSKTPPPPTPEPVAEKSLKVLEFLEKSGPAGGKDYALLILWCFIAGFAERFVPDALDRFIKRSGAGDGGKN